MPRFKQGGSRGLVEDVTEGKQIPCHETNFRQNVKFRRSGSDDRIELAQVF